MPRTAPYLLTLLIFLLAGWSPAAGSRTTQTSDVGGYRVSSLLTSHSALATQTSPDGHRLTKLVSDNGLTQRVHRYLTDANNPTGYAQVIEETDPLAPSGQQLKKVHLYGHDLISSSVSQPSTPNSQLLFYSYDGLGSVRSITNESGDLEETYDYDAYGTLIGLAKRNAEGDLESTPIYDLQSAITKSEFLFTGEQWDSDLNMYFLRARYLDTNTGRFHTQDTYEGHNGEPLTLHKYLYANGNPVMHTDPSGQMTLAMEMSTGISLSISLDKVAYGMIATAWTVSRRWIITAWHESRDFGHHFFIHAVRIAGSPKQQYRYDWYDDPKRGSVVVRESLTGSGSLPEGGIPFSPPVVISDLGHTIWENWISAGGFSPGRFTVTPTSWNCLYCFGWTISAYARAAVTSVIPF